MEDTILFRFPDETGMRRRLEGITADGYTEEWLAQSLMPLAGTQLHVNDLPMKLFDTIMDAHKEHPESRMTIGAVTDQVDVLIDVLIDSRRTREAARRAWYAATETD